MDPKTLEGEAPSSSSSSSYGWKERIFIPALLAGIVGGGVGLVSKHRKIHGLANISATYATNFAIVTGCYYGAREIVMKSRLSHPDDLLNSAFAGFGTGAILGRLQGGKYGAVKYSVIFSVVGTTVDYATIKLKPVLRSYTESILGKDGAGFKWPEWSPIQVLDEEKLAAKRAREKELYSQRILGKINKEES
ncbi:hypothetical protein FEM48_Zijuj05G0059600 [Ziziphus jujuba var. spinosa]|uniref:Uncharacterized protein n=1 Tax=Ziziphus jujuba var. spinosa TaxID=714518 RepID=A0A978VD75_ZIZJJ|nr:hypothetical protein FEM48_Zijuj05G0059600 [Ziziphus jujuba var. spinosa]